MTVATLGRCAASVKGTEYGVLSHLPHRCTAPAREVVTMRQFGDDDVQRPACGTHARVARNDGTRVRRMTHAVSGLFGAMVALLVYTRLGGLATVLTAGAILVGYILVEMYRGWRELEQSRRDRRAAYFRLQHPVTTRNGKPSSRH